MLLAGFISNSASWMIIVYAHRVHFHQEEVNILLLISYIDRSEHCLPASPPALPPPPSSISCTNAIAGSILFFYVLSSPDYFQFIDRRSKRRMPRAFKRNLAQFVSWTSSTFLTSYFPREAEFIWQTSSTSQLKHAWPELALLVCWTAGQAQL